MNEQEIQQAVNVLLEKGKFSGRYEGNDNYKRPKTDYLRKLVVMTNEQLRKECDSLIWLSAYANNNPRSDYHFKCDACYDECERRKRPDIYKKSYDEILQSLK